MQYDGKPRVVIIGGGFAGLACARELGGEDIQVTLIDRRNHNLFQPLLYQVATGALSPADIAEPIRQILGKYENIRVFLAEATGIDLARKYVLTDRMAPVSFDHLVLATGSDYNYFGHDKWREVAPGLKTLREARAIRQRLLLAFERAEMAADDESRQQLLTSIVVGGGPTGVELAGAIAGLGRLIASRDFRFVRPEHVRVILFEGGTRVLQGFPESLSRYAAGRLESLGVRIITGCTVEAIEESAVMAQGERLAAGSVIWAAGVKASPAADWLGIEADKGGRVPVDPYLEVPGMPNVHVIGDTALARDAETGEAYPGLAQVAKQQGRWLGIALRRKIVSGERGPPFRFRNRGSTAVIARNAAIMDFGSIRLTGRLAWLLWVIVHVLLLHSFEKRVLVSLQWMWRHATQKRSARLVDEPLAPEPQEEPAPELEHPPAR